MKTLKEKEGWTTYETCRAFIGQRFFMKKDVVDALLQFKIQLGKQVILTEHIPYYDRIVEVLDEVFGKIEDDANEKESE